MIYGYRRLIIFLLALAVSSYLCAPPVVAHEFDIRAREYILMDYETGTILASKNADARMTPSSMTKLMTAYVVFTALNSGQLSLDDSLIVSTKAWRDGGAASGGSTMFLEPGSKVKVKDLIRGMLIQSGNDASIVLAEGLAGTEDAFAKEMNDAAKKLHLKNSHFVNASGLPDDDHYMSARDLASLAQRLIAEFPQYYSIFGETSFAYNQISQGNRNPLLYRAANGVDGLKTGHTTAGGYGLTASALRNGRRLVLVANGMDSADARAEESAKLLEYGFREFVNVKLFDADEEVTRAEVWLGDKPTVGLNASTALTVTLKRGASSPMRVVARYNSPIPAPIAAGANVGMLIIQLQDRSPVTMPLNAGSSVPSSSIAKKLRVEISYIFSHLW